MKISTKVNFAVVVVLDNFCLSSTPVSECIFDEYHNICLCGEIRKISILFG